jgi:hypothetical protein
MIDRGEALRGLDHVVVGGVSSCGGFDCCCAVIWRSDQLLLAAVKVSVQSVLRLKKSAAACSEGRPGRFHGSFVGLRHDLCMFSASSSEQWQEHALSKLELVAQSAPR